MDNHYKLSGGLYATLVRRPIQSLGAVVLGLSGAAGILSLEGCSGGGGTDIGPCQESSVENTILDTLAYYFMNSIPVRYQNTSDTIDPTNRTLFYELDRTTTGNSSKFEICLPWDCRDTTYLSQPSLDELINSGYAQVEDNGKKIIITAAGLAFLLADPVNSFSFTVTQQPTYPVDPGITPNGRSIGVGIKTN